MRRACALCVCLIATSCSNANRPAPVPELDAAAAAAAAMSKLDANRDGALSKDELAGSPGILAAIAFYDADRDGSLSQAEIRARLKSWYAKNVGLMSFRATVAYQGKPLADATVLLHPEEFLGGAIKPARGKSDSLGVVDFQVDDPALHEGLLVIQPGLYRVEVTHPKLPINSKYRATLGVEALPDYLVGKNLTFDVGP